MAKGQKTGGRQKGTPNRLTGSVKDMLNVAIRSEIESLPILIEHLEPKDRIDVILKILPYILPKAENHPGDEVRPGIMKEKHSFITKLLSEQFNMLPQEIK